jgi:hypothetical protein
LRYLGIQQLDETRRNIGGAAEDRLFAPQLFGDRRRLRGQLLALTNRQVAQRLLRRIRQRDAGVRRVE